MTAVSGTSGWLACPEQKQNMWESEHLTLEMTAPAGRTWPVLTIASSTSAVPSLWPLMLMTSSIRPVIW